MNTTKIRLVALVTALVAMTDAPAAALAQKGGGQIGGTGEKASDLVSGIVTPLLIVAVGVMVLTAVVARNAGLAISAIGIGLLAGFFLIEPGTAEDAFTGIYKAIF